MDSGPVLSLLGSVVGALVAGYYVMRSGSLQVKLKLKEQCYSAFLRFHAAISSVTFEYAPAIGGAGWHDEYLSKRKAMEPVADELVALTHLTLSADLAGRVEKLRREFRVWEADYLISNNPQMPNEDRAAASRSLVSDRPKKILAMVDGVTREYREALEGFR